MCNSVTPIPSHKLEPQEIGIHESGFRYRMSVEGMRSRLLLAPHDMICLVITPITSSNDKVFTFHAFNRRGQYLRTQGARFAVQWKISAWNLSGTCCWSVGTVLGSVWGKNCTESKCARALSLSLSLSDVPTRTCKTQQPHTAAFNDSMWLQVQATPRAVRTVTSLESIRTTVCSSAMLRTWCSAVTYVAKAASEYSCHVTNARIKRWATSWLTGLGWPCIQSIYNQIYNSICWV